MRLAGRRHGMALGVLVALLSAAGGLGLAPTAARAGDWIQVSCVNPNGSASPSEGWSGVSQYPTEGSSVNSRCGPGDPMIAELSALAPAPVTESQQLVFTPPAGSTIDGGTLDLALRADGDGPGGSSTATVYAPQFAFPADVLLFCANGQGPCSSGSAPDDYTGNFTLPADLGGQIFVVAGCGGASNGECNTAADNTTLSSASVVSSQIEMSNDSVPVAANVTGTVLGRTTRGTPHLVFTASDPGGPGVYAVTVSIDGTPVYSGTPNTNGGACVPVGTGASGALMFDHQQPCPATEAVTVPVPTTAFPDGAHELTATVTDAAGNVATVVDDTIHTSNPQLTPKPRHGVRTRFDLHWRWRRATTTLRSIAAHEVPRGGRMSVACLGVRHRHHRPTGCPRLKVRSVRTRSIATLLHGLRGRQFHAGARLRLTVSAPHRRAERIELRFRDGHKPTARLLGR